MVQRPTSTGVHFTISTWSAFRSAWDGVHNFLMAGECVPFAFDMPPLERVVEELRSDPEARIGPGVKDRALAKQDPAFAQRFRETTIDEALRSPFSLAHFRLSAFDAPGKVLHGFKEAVLDPWQAALREQGFTWERCYPIVFVSGPDSATNYHMDLSHVLAWQVHGAKRFCGLRDPDRWAPREVRLSYAPDAIRRPEALTADDMLRYEMPPGAVLWNALLTPHWVDASGGAAMSVNLSHGGLRLDGQLCRNEQELEEHRAYEPERAPANVEGAY